jgi:hypothetical protein
MCKAETRNSFIGNRSLFAWAAAVDLFDLELERRFPLDSAPAMAAS